MWAKPAASLRAGSAADHRSQRVRAPRLSACAVVSLGVLFGPLGLSFGFPLSVVIDVVAIGRLYALDT